jgi:hypothetical protein
MNGTKAIRTTVVLSPSLFTGLHEAADASVAGLTVAHLIRQFIAEGLQRLKQQPTGKASR